MDHEDALHADALEDAANGDGLVEAAVALGDDHAFEGLDALLVALGDAHADPDGVADVDVGELLGVLGDLLGLKGLHQGVGAELAHSCFCSSRLFGHSYGGVSCSLGAGGFLGLFVLDLVGHVLGIRCHPSSVKTPGQTTSVLAQGAPEFRGRRRHSRRIARVVPVTSIHSRPSPLSST